MDFGTDEFLPNWWLLIIGNWYFYRYRHPWNCHRSTPHPFRNVSLSQNCLTDWLTWFQTHTHSHWKKSFKFAYRSFGSIAMARIRKGFPNISRHCASRSPFTILCTTLVTLHKGLNAAEGNCVARERNWALIGGKFTTSRGTEKALRVDYLRYGIK